jgi:hypothetical protein
MITTRSIFTDQATCTSVNDAAKSNSSLYRTMC